MTLYWKLFLVIVMGFYILSLTSFATGFDVSPDKKCPLCASACFCPSLHQIVCLLTVLVALSTSWAAVHKSLMGQIYSTVKVVSFLDIFGRIVAVSLCNVFFTTLHFIWWRPVASVLCIGLGVIFNAQIQNLWNSCINLSRWKMGFVFLFVFKFLKVVVHSISYLTYRPQLPLAKNATYDSLRQSTMMDAFIDLVNNDEDMEMSKDDEELPKDIIRRQSDLKKALEGLQNKGKNKSKDAILTLGEEKAVECLINDIFTTANVAAIEDIITSYSSKGWASVTSEDWLIVTDEKSTLTRGQLDLMFGRLDTLKTFLEPQKKLQEKTHGKTTRRSQKELLYRAERSTAMGLFSFRYKVFKKDIRDKNS